MNSPLVQPFFDEASNTFSYVIQDPASQACAILDSVLNFDYASGRTSTGLADEIVTYTNSHKLKVEWVLETHVHADHLSAAHYLRERLGGKTGIGSHIREIQSAFGEAFNAGSGFACDGSQFDQLFKDGDSFLIGDLECRVLHTPGHTPACLTYLIGDAAFVGDTLFMPDYGTARCDFPGGDARMLYRSIHKVFALPPETRVFLCHDYKAPGREHYVHMTTLREQRETNIHIHQGISEDEFMIMRTERDATLGMPQLILPSVQVNMRAGRMPPADDNGQVYLKVPINRF